MVASIFTNFICYSSLDREFSKDSPRSKQCSIVQLSSAAVVFSVFVIVEVILSYLIFSFYIRARCNEIRIIDQNQDGNFLGTNEEVIEVEAQPAQSVPNLCVGAPVLGPKWQSSQSAIDNTADNSFLYHQPTQLRTLLGDNTDRPDAYHGKILPQIRCVKFCYRRT